MREGVMQDDLEIVKDHDIRNGKHLCQTRHAVCVSVGIQGRHYITGDMLGEEHVFEQHSYTEENADDEHDKDETEQKCSHSPEPKHEENCKRKNEKQCEVQHEITFQPDEYIVSCIRLKVNC